MVFEPTCAAYLRLRLSLKLRSGSPLKIHFGCGEIADARFLNIDARVFPHVEYITKSPMMPAIHRGSATLIYACHVFEHIPYDAQRVVLRRWYDMLQSQGELRLSVPDFEKVTALYQSKKRPFDWVQAVLMGGQEYAGNFHYALFTAEKLRKLLEDAGFINVRHWKSSEQDNWPKDWSWDETLSLNLCADKP